MLCRLADDVPKKYDFNLQGLDTTRRGWNGEKLVEKIECGHGVLKQDPQLNFEISQGGEPAQIKWDNFKNI